VIAIWVRRTVDWSDEEVVDGQLRDELRGQVDLWNASFTMPFHLFRQRVREIAADNHAAVEGAVCADWEEIPEGALVLPVDDDDWFAPGVAGELAAAPKAEAYYWGPRWLQVERNLGHRFYVARVRLLPWTPGQEVFATNNYALVKRPGVEALATSHAVADRWFKAGAKERVRRLPGSLSLMNRTLGSSTALRWKRVPITGEELLRRFRRYERLYDGPAPRGLAWSEPYRRRMAELMRELELAR